MSHDSDSPDAPGPATDKQQEAAAAPEATPELIEQITAVAPALVYLFDVQTRTRIWQNRWLPALLGYEGREDFGAYEFMDEIVHPDSQAPLTAYRRALAHQPDHVVSEVEYRAQHTDGSWHWILSRNLVFARASDGTVRQVIGSVTDITGVKRAEEELRRLNAELELRVTNRTADLAAANHELEAFAYSVSHDLRGPLRTINGFTDRVLETNGERLDDQARRDLQRVRAAAQRMADMIDGLLALSRTARSEISPRPVDLGEVARAVMAELRQTEPNRNVDVVLSEHVPVMGDPRLLRILLDNLLGNAWKFTSRRPDARIEFGTRIEHGTVIYFVSDNGAGFDMAHARALFTPFERLHRIDEFTGTGIGLATVQRIVQRHGGAIWAHSAPGQGARFYFTLPAGDTLAADRNDPARPEERERG